MVNLLKRARDEYRSGEREDESPQPGWNPYACINRLQLDTLLNDFTDGSPAKALAKAGRCQAAARSRYGQSYEFFDAVMAADAETAKWLLEPAPSTDEVTEKAAVLLQVYRDAVHELAATPRQFDSVARQLRILSTFLKARAKEDDGQRAEVLEAVADGLIDRAPQPKSTPDATADTESTPPPEPEAASTNENKSSRGRSDKRPK